MSLHCPTTLFIARHGDAAYDHAHVMSDDGGWLSELGQRQVRACADGLREQRIALVYGSPLSRAVESAELAAGALGVGSRTRAGLEEVRVGDAAGRPWGDPEVLAVWDRWFAGDLSARVPGAESGAEVVARVSAALQTIADEHRGEQVLVFTHGGVMSLVVPMLAANAANTLAHGRFLPNAVPAHVEVGDDGWWLHSWPGEVDPAVV